MRRAGWSVALAAAVATVVSGALVVPTSAAAPLELASSSPADGSHVQTASTLSATFSAAVDVASAQVSVTNAAHDPIASGAPVFSGGDTTVTVTPDVPLVSDIYTVSYSVDAATGNDHLDTSVTFAFGTAVLPPAAPTIGDVSLANVTAVPVSGTATETGGSVHVVVSDGNGHTATADPVLAGDNTWSTTLDLSLAGQPLDDGTLTATVTQSDTSANVSAPSAPDTAVKDTVAPDAPTGLGFDGPSRFGDTGVVLSGSGENGTTVSVSVTDADATTPVPATTTVAGGSWSANVETSTLHDGTLTATVTLTDGLGNVSGQATATTPKDIVVPASPGSLAFDRNADAADQTVELSGTGEDGAILSITVDDEVGGSYPVPSPPAISGGLWAKSIDLSVSGLADGTLTATVTESDSVGNVSQAATQTVLKDVVVPGAPSAPVLADVTASNNTAVPVSGTTQESGGTVTVTVTDGVHDATKQVAVPGSAWSTTIDLSGLDEGAISAKAVQTDGVGNASVDSSTTPAVKDTVLPNAPAAPTIPDIDKANVTSVPVSGTVTESGGSVHVVVSDGTHQVTADPVLSGTSWSADLDLSSLDQGAVTAVARQTDAVGNASAYSNPGQALKDTVVLAPSSMVFDGPVTLKENALVLSGHGEPGAQLTVRLADTASGTPNLTKTPSVGSGGNWSASFAYDDVVQLVDGTLTATVRQTDGVGNVSPSATATVKKDTKRPVVTLTGPTTHFVLGATRVSWDGKGAASYDVGYTQSKSGGYLGSAVYPFSWQRIATESVSRSQPLGTTDCYFVRGRDSVGNTSFYTPQRCTTRPFDDRSLVASSGWTKVTGKAFYRHTVRRTTHRGATLTLGTTFVYRVGLVATTCDGCGKVAVMINGVQVGLFDLDRNRTRHHRVLAMTVPEQSGKVVLKVVSARKKVEVDGFVVTRI